MPVTDGTLRVLRYSGLCDPASAAWLLCAAVFFDCFSSCLMLWPAGASLPNASLQTMSHGLEQPLVGAVS